LYVFVRLTQQQKQTRIDWIVEDLKANGVLPQDSNVDSRLFVIRSADQVCYIKNNCNFEGRDRHYC